MTIKRILITLIILSMIGWATYEFIFSKDTTKEDEPATEVSTETSSKEQKQDTEEKVVGLRVGNIAPDFELTTMDGKTVKLSDYRGKRVMLNFWATWCPPCRAEIPDMQKFYENEDVEILAVNLTETETSQEQVKQFIEEYGMTFPVLLDEKLEVADTYQIQPIPTSYMIDSEGVISFVAPGALHYQFMVSEFKKMH